MTELGATDRRLRVLLGIAAAAASLLTLAAPATAQGIANPLAGGTTTLHLKRGFLAELAARDVRLSTGDGIGQTGRTLTLAVAGGALDPVDGKGAIEQDGILRLRHGRLRATVVGLDADTASGIVRAEVAGAEMKLGFLAGQTSERAGFGVNVKATALKLSARAARRLSRRLNLDPGLTPGRTISNLYSATQPRTVAVAASPVASYPVLLGSDPATNPGAGKMFAKGLAPFGISPAYAKYPPSMQWPPMHVILFFPLEGGSIAPDASRGTLSLSGGIELRMQATGARIARTGITLDLGTRTMASPEGPMASLGAAGTTVWSNPAERTIYVQGIEVDLSAPFAELLNETFNPLLPAPLPGTDFREGDVLGGINFFLKAR